MRLDFSKMPKFEIVEVSASRFQINEIWPDRTVFIGLRESREQAETSVAKMKQDYNDYFRPYYNFANPEVANFKPSDEW